MPFPTPFWTQGFVIFFLAGATAFGQTTNAAFAPRSARAFAHAQKELAAHPNDATNVWWLARACYESAELSTNEDQRASFAKVGIDACQKLVARDPKSAAGHYYLAMNYGELAEAEAPSMAAYKLIREIEREFKITMDLNERLDYAGPVRCLGLLYRDAPGWPVSIGSKRKAREYLERAVALEPDFPENQIDLLESHILWRQADEAQAVWHKLAAIWPAARTNLAGLAWDSYWDDWNHRRTTAKADFEKTFKQTLAP